MHVSNLFGNIVGPEVAVTLDRLVGGGTTRAGGQVFFTNSGAEANECALKLARKWAGPDRHVVVSTWDAFHGRTLATLAATGQPEKQTAFAPMPDGFDHVGYDDFAALEAACDPPRVAAVLLEPIQGEAGVIAPSSDYLGAVREMCSERGILLMVDEIQTGLGRTGRWFAFQHTGIEPDVVTMAKALGNGVPIGACWARAEVAAAFSPGDHGSTFGGQPLAAAAARATLAVMEAEDVPGRAARAGAVLRAGLERLDGVVGVRGMGLLLGAALDHHHAKDVAARGAGAGARRERAPPRHHPAGPVVVGERRRDRRGAGAARRGPGRRGPVHEGGGVMTRHFLDVDDLSCDELDDVLATAVAPGGRGAQGAGRSGCGPRLREAVGPHPELDRARRGRARGPSRLHPGPRGRHGRARDGRGRGPDPGVLPRRAVRAGARSHHARAHGGRARRDRRCRLPATRGIPGAGAGGQPALGPGSSLPGPGRSA